VTGYLAELRQQGLAAWTVITRDRALRIWLNWRVEWGSSRPVLHPARLNIRHLTDASSVW